MPRNASVSKIGGLTLVPLTATRIGWWIRAAVLLSDAYVHDPDSLAVRVRREMEAAFRQPNRAP